MQFKSLLAAAALLKAISAEYTPGTSTTNHGSYYLTFAEGELPEAGYLYLSGVVHSSATYPVHLEGEDDVGSITLNKTSSYVNPTNFTSVWHHDGSYKYVSVFVLGHMDNTSSASSAVDFLGRFITDADKTIHDFKATAK